MYYLRSDSEVTMFAKNSKLNVTQDTKYFISIDLCFMCTLV